MIERLRQRRHGASHRETMRSFGPSVPLIGTDFRLKPRSERGWRRVECRGDCIVPPAVGTTKMLWLQRRGGDGNPTRRSSGPCLEIMMVFHASRRASGTVDWDDVHAVAILAEIVWDEGGRSGTSARAGLHFRSAVRGPPLSPISQFGRGGGAKGCQVRDSWGWFGIAQTVEQQRQTGTRRPSGFAAIDAVCEPLQHCFAGGAVPGK